MATWSPVRSFGVGGSPRVGPERVAHDEATLRAKRHVADALPTLALVVGQRPSCLVETMSQSKMF